MTIHKFFRLCSLTVASLFWASCSDSDPQFYYPQSAKLDPSEDVGEDSSSSETSDAESSSSAETESSSAESVESSSSAGNPPESFSETPTSSSANSSSSGVSSSSESERYILAKDSSVTCVKESQMFPSTSCQTSSDSYTCDDYKKYLGKDTSVTERVLNKWEDALEFCGAISEMPSVVYGVFPPACNPNAVYLSSVLKCSNDSTYRYYQLDGNLA